MKIKLTFSFKKKEFIDFADRERVEETVLLLQDWFDFAIGSDHSQLSSYFNKDFNLSYANNWALFAAMDSKAERLVGILVKYAQQLGIDLTMDDNYLIRWACEHGFVEIAQDALADPAVDPNAFDSEITRDNALKIAARNGHSKIVEMLLMGSDK